MDPSPPLNAVKVVNNYQNAQEGIWPNGPVQLARGRQAKDPNAKTVTYNVASIDEFETSLREFLQNPPEHPEHTDCQLSFYTNTSFLVNLAPPSQNAAQQPQPQHSHAPDTIAQLALAQHQHQSHAPHAHSSHSAHVSHPQAPPGYQPANSIHYAANASHTYQSVSDPAIALTLPNYASPSNANGSSSSTNGKEASSFRHMTILEALENTADPKEKMKKQRSIAKCCVEAIQRTDGYRYSFHNCWNSREDDSFRFSYYCNDSLLNKDRAANGKGAKFGKRATKPVYDCKGVLSVKFSASKQSLDVFYKHIPVHKTYEERAPPPRKDSKRRKYLEENDPEALIRIANRPKPLKPPELPGDPNAPSKSKKKKTKRDDEPKTAANSIESDLRAQSLRSLLELIQTDPEPIPSEPPQVQNKAPIQNPNTRLLETATQQLQPAPSQPRRRPRNSCDVCKAKKTKCDGVRPVCHTCFDKNRQCYYSEPYAGDDRRQSMPDPTHSEPILHAQAAGNELSELEKMKKELEEARAKIQELEAEKSRPSNTPSQTAQAPRNQTQSQPAQQPQPQPQIRNAAQANGQPQPQIRSAAQPQQQIRNAAMQNPQYFNSNHSPYTANRPMPSGGHPSQPQASQQMHTPNTGLTPTQDPTNPYDNRDFTWPAYYNYQNAPQSPQDQWTAAATRNFR